MNLTPEQKDVGIENFRSAIASKHMRQKFLDEAVSKHMATKKGLGAHHFKYGTVDKPVKIGVIGTGDEGNVLIGSLNPKYVQVVAIADIRPYNIYRAFNGDKSSKNTRRVRPGLMKVFGWPNEAIARRNVKVYDKHYEDLLDDQNVEAVIVALPLHLHAEASIKALRKGKHVLCEKLMAHSVHQCKEMARVSDETGKILTVGHQRHYSALYDNAVDVIRQGLLGEVHHIRAQWHRGNLPGNDSWQQPLPDEQMKKDLQAAQVDLDTDQGEYDKTVAEAKKKLTGNALKLIEKFDGELKDRPEQIKKLGEQLLALGDSDADKAKSKQLTDKILAHQKRIEAVKKAYPKKLVTDKKDKKTTKRLSDLAKRIPNLADEVERLTHQLKDADLGDAVKDFGYQEQTVGSQKVTAMEELIRWRLWNRTGGGLMAELGSHQLDAAGIFINAQGEPGHHIHPLSVAAVGGRHVFPHDRDIDDHVYCSFEFPGVGYDENDEELKNKKVVVSYSSINGNGYGGYGEMVFGTKGTLLIDREKDVMLFKGSDTTTYTQVAPEGKKRGLRPGKKGNSDAYLGAMAMKGPNSRGYTEEIEHWAFSIRNPDSDVKLRCGPEVALADAVIALTTNIVMADENKGRIKFDKAWYDYKSDATPEGIAPNVDRPEYKV